MSLKIVLALFLVLLQVSCGSGVIINPTSTLVPTMQITSTREVNILASTSTPTTELYGDQSHSPDQQWIVSVYKSFENDETFLTLVVEKQDGSVMWVAEKVLAGQSAALAQYPTPFHWSTDSKTFYFTNLGFQDGCFSYSEGGKKLFSLDLGTGNVRTVLNEFASEMKFSPDESMIAYVNYGDTGLQILDVKTGDKIEFEHLYPDLLTDQYGLAWSPDSTQLAFTILLEACITDRATSIIIADIASMSQKILVNEDERPLGSEEWLDESRILVSDWSENSWYLNPQTGELTPIIQVNKD